VARPAGLYLHLPFCATSCAYCTFVTTTRGELLPRYMACLRQELEKLGQRAGRPLVTCYLGGGTPSLVPEAELAATFQVLDRYFPRLSGAEVTLEANPDDVTEDKLAFWRTLGVNRVSLGVQSFADPLLRLLARRHDAAQAARALEACLAAGFVVNCDLMLALPGLSLGELEASLEKLLEARPHHVSLYLLEMDKPHRLAQLAARRPELFPSEEAAARQYLYASRRLRQAGYRHYEISNFALPGYYARHNLRYWRGGVVLACGVAAAGQGRSLRFRNTEDLAAYMAAVEAGRSPRVETRRLLPEDALAEAVMLRLRLAWGAPSPAVEAVAQARPAFGQLLEDFRAAGLARTRGGRVALTPKGWLVSNELFATLV